MFRRVFPYMALCLALSGPVQGQSLEDAREALATGDAEAARALLADLMSTGAPDALALAGLMLRDGLGSEADLQGAMALFESSAAAGSVTAQVALGRIYHHGAPGVPADPLAAQRHYEAAIEAGSVSARTNLAALIASGVFGPPNWTALRGLLETAAEEGSTAARLHLAALLAQGLGGEADPFRARDLAEALVDERVPGAARLLAQMQVQGVGGAADPEAARALLREAFEAGEGAAATDLALLTQVEDPEAALRWFTRAAELGDGWGALNLGRLLSDGEAAPDDDLPRATELYRQAHAAGIAEASYALGIHLWDGLGVESDLEAARTTMRLAALRGSVAAMNDLGVMLETGIGGPPDPQGAREAYRDSAEAGYVLGAWNLADLLLSVAATPDDAAEGYAWCLWAIAAEVDATLRARHQASCNAHAQTLSEAVLRASEARFAELPDPASAIR